MIRLLLALLLLATATATAQTTGPCVGSTGPHEAFFLFRPGEVETSLRLTVIGRSDEVVTTAEARASAADDYVAKFHAQGLEPATGYRYHIEELTATGAPKVLAAGDDLAFRTVDSTRGGKASAALISCVSKADTAPVWAEIGELSPDLLYLGGDTPYIDTADLAAIRKKHRAFLDEPELAKIVRRISTVGIWDDHDFGKNNGNGGNFKHGKAATRKGFVEYRAHRRYGDGAGNGVYHKSDLGAMEIFHLDPRWFSQTEPSPIDEFEPTCYGKAQWDWILKSLKESEAPFKVLSMGAIWQDKKNSETDDMFTYWYERDALLDFIKRERISGVVLHGGDIHVARHLVHPQRVGYDLHDFIMSPGHKRVIPSLDVYHPDLEWSLVEGQQFLLLEADATGTDPTLTATYRQPGGKVNRKVVLKLSDLTPPEKIDSLRARWSFEKDLTNGSPLGKRLDAKAHNGATIKAGALKLDRAKGQFASVPRSFLDDNSAAHAISCWIRPATLPAHGSKDRHFILESTAEGKPDPKAAYHLSLELSPAAAADQIAIRLHTQTLKSNGAQKGPSAKAQGPFTTTHPRSAIEAKWSHLLVSFDSEQLKVYLNGKQVTAHDLPHPGPAAEFGGLIIGGHRAGTGRNFDGEIDELTIWQGALSPTDAAKLHSDGR